MSLGNIQNKNISGTVDINRKYNKAVELEQEKQKRQDAIRQPDDIFSSAGDGDKIKSEVTPQDPQVGGTEKIESDRDMLGTELDGERVQGGHRGPDGVKVTADKDGNYLAPIGSEAFNQINSTTLVAHTLDMAEEYAGRKIEWAFKRDQIPVTIDTSKRWPNAYYSRNTVGGRDIHRGVNFFRFDGPDGKEINTAQSADVVSHEAGHAILDALRPGFFSTWDSETGAFHEAFGDCIAMVFNLRFASNRAQVLKETGGDLSKHSILSSLGEEFGTAIAKQSETEVDNDWTWLRTALNKFEYVNPRSLPSHGDRDELVNEVHSFANVFSGAFYDGIHNAFDKMTSDGAKPEAALGKVGDDFGKILIRAVELSSPTETSFKEIGEMMLKADQQLFDGAYQDSINRAFSERKIFGEGSKPSLTANSSLPDIRLTRELKTPAHAVAFLAENIDKLNFQDLYSFDKAQVTHNNRGETFILLQTETEESAMTGNEETFDVPGGILLAFDSEGQLFHMKKQELNEARVSSERASLWKSLRLGEVFLPASSSSIGEEKFSSYDDKLFKGVVADNKFVRVPVSLCDHDHEHDHSHEGHEHEPTTEPAEWHLS